MSAAVNLPIVEERWSVKGMDLEYALCVDVPEGGLIPSGQSWFVTYTAAGASDATRQAIREFALAGVKRQYEAGPGVGPVGADWYITKVDYDDGIWSLRRDSGETLQVARKDIARLEQILGAIA